MLDNSQEAYVLLDHDYKIVYMSPTASQITGYFIQDFQDESVTKLIKLDEFNKFKVYLGRADDISMVLPVIRKHSGPLNTLCHFAKIDHCKDNQSILIRLDATQENSRKWPISMMWIVTVILAVETYLGYRILVENNKNIGKIQQVQEFIEDSKKVQMGPFSIKRDSAELFNSLESTVLPE